MPTHAMEAQRRPRVAGQASWEKMGWGWGAAPEAAGEGVGAPEAAAVGVEEVEVDGAEEEEDDEVGAGGKAATVAPMTLPPLSSATKTSECSPLAKRAGKRSGQPCGRDQLLLVPSSRPPGPSTILLTVVLTVHCPETRPKTKD